MNFAHPMRSTISCSLFWVVLAALPVAELPAQVRTGRGARPGVLSGGYVKDGEQHRLSSEPGWNWNLKPGFGDDAYVFARLIYGSSDGIMGNLHFRTGASGWRTDSPDADFNLAFRLHQLTSLQVRPGETDVEIRPETLARYPFVYIVEPGRLVFSGDQVQTLRRYLMNGGFLMIDDNWGDDERYNIQEQMGRVFPKFPMVELEINHPIFHSVFDLQKKPQMPAIPWFDGELRSGMEYEPNKPYDKESHGPHYFGIFDDKGRMMVFISHNCDLGDGWEREGMNIEYFKKFSEPQAYPMMINVIFYAMTH